MGKIPAYDPLFGGHLGQLIASNRRYGVNGAIRELMTHAIDFARASSPDGHLVELKVPLIPLLKLLFPGGRFDNPRGVYIVYSHAALTEVMRRAYDYEKGEKVKYMSNLMGSSPKAGEIITADMDEWAKMQPVVKDYVWGDAAHTQARFIEENLNQRFDVSGDLDISTSDIKELMFSLIGRLMIPDYQPSLEKVQGHVKEFEWLISNTSKILFDTIFASEKFSSQAMNSPLANEIQERFIRFFAEVSANWQAGDGGMLAALMDHPNYSPEKRQATIVGMFEAGSKTLTQVTMETFLACTQDRKLWEYLKANSDKKTLTQAFLEAARRTPPVDLTFRETYEDEDLLGCHIPKGSILILSIKDTLLDADYWDDPQAFIIGREDPERRRYLPWLDPMVYERGCTGFPYAISVGIATLKFFLENFEHVQIQADHGMHYDATVQHNLSLSFRH